MRLALFLAPCLVSVWFVVQAASGQVIWAATSTQASTPNPVQATPRKSQGTTAQSNNVRANKLQGNKVPPVQHAAPQVVFSPAAAAAVHAVKSAAPPPKAAAVARAPSRAPVRVATRSAVVRSSGVRPTGVRTGSARTGAALRTATTAPARQIQTTRLQAKAPPRNPQVKARAVAAAPAVMAAAPAVRLTGTRVSGVVVRVLLTQVPAVRVAQQSLDGSVSAQWAFSASGNTLLIAGKPVAQSAFVIPASATNLLTVQGRSYRGALLVRAVGGEVQVVNAVDMESYLRSVVPSEMPGSWPIAALRAQAIIARTYAAARINPQAPYDLCDTAQCQDYRGVEREYPNSDKAVADTRGEVMSSGSRLADTYFSADSGGYTASSEEAWGMHLPYLQARPDPYSTASAWKLQPTLDAVTRAASLYGVRVGGVQRVNISQVSRSGRALELSFVGKNGTQTLHGENINRFLRQLGGKSSRIVLVSRPGWLEITGYGFGHGVGLSQEGARNMADQGVRTEQILNFYYPGAALTGLRALAFGGVSLGESYPLAQLARSESLAQRLQAQAALAAPLNRVPLNIQPAPLGVLALVPQFSASPFLAAPSSLLPRL